MAAEVLRLDFKRPLGLDIYMLFLRRLAREGIKEVQRGVLKEIADAVLEMVAARYRALPLSLTGGSQEVYAQGKLRGVWAARVRHRPSGGLRRTMALQKALRIRWEGKDTVWVEINPSATYSGMGGEPADREGAPAGSKSRRPVSIRAVAEQWEDPVTVVIPKTSRVLAYLAVLARGEAGPTAKRKTARRAGTPTNKVYGTIVYRPRARPVWQPVHRGLTVLQPRFVVALRRNLWKLAREAGWP